MFAKHAKLRKQKKYKKKKAAIVERLRLETRERAGEFAKISLKHTQSQASADYIDLPALQLDFEIRKMLTERKRAEVYRQRYIFWQHFCVCLVIIFVSFVATHFFAIANFSASFFVVRLWVHWLSHFVRVSLGFCYIFFYFFFLRIEAYTRRL